MRYTLTLERWTPPRLNQFRGRHWRAEARYKRVTADILKAEALSQGVPPATGQRRVWVLCSGWSRGGRVPDADSLDKCLLDALVTAGLLLDDDARWLEGRLLVTIERGPQRTVIVLEEAASEDVK